MACATHEISNAVTLILKGKFDEGAHELSAFEVNNPQSPLLASIRQAREALQTLAKRS